MSWTTTTNPPNPHTKHNTTLLCMQPTLNAAFTVDDGDYRKSDSLCESPTGKVAVRDGLFIFSFVVSLLIFLLWLVCLVYLLYKRYCAKDPPKSPGYVYCWCSYSTLCALGAVYVTHCVYSVYQLHNVRSTFYPLSNKLPSMKGECCTNNNLYCYETKANSSQSIELGDINHYVV